jgi:hypothetical protein
MSPSVGKPLEDAYQIVAQVCKPAYTVVSKLPKAQLPNGPVYQDLHASLRERARDLTR